MRLTTMKVTNFRCFKQETALDLENLTILVGKNDAGKSSLFDALDIFFNGTPEQDDVYVHGDDTKVSIACVFDELPAELIIDEQHPTNLKAEYLLNQDGKLEIVKVFNCSGCVKTNALRMTRKEERIMEIDHMYLTEKEVSLLTGLSLSGLRNSRFNRKGIAKHNRNVAHYPTQKHHWKRSMIPVKLLLRMLRIARNVSDILTRTLNEGFCTPRSISPRNL